MNMGASFNRTSWQLKGAVLGTEMRALNNLAWARPYSCDQLYGCDADMVGLSGYGPNLNIARDPRFGRVSELPSEDPIHAGIYGREMVSGMQKRDAAGFPLMLAYLKHFTAYSREENRRHSEANISTFDLYDTYVRQYELAFTRNPNPPSGVMCSYASINGTPSCASDLLLNQLLREKWAQPNALVTTDCGSIEDMLEELEPAPGHTRLAATPEEASAWAIMNGTDLEAGGTIWTEHLMNATRLGLATEEAITQAARRALRQHFVAGRFDSGAWAEVGVKHINSSAHQQVQAEAALQGIVLLKNENELLPLTRGAHIAVVGPLAVDVNLLSDYAGTGGCWPNGDLSCVLTIAQAIARANTGGVTRSVNSSVAEAVSAARAAEVVVVVVGNDRSAEHEGVDRADVPLPTAQLRLARAVLELRRPTLLLLSNGGAVSLDGLIEGSRAIVESFSLGHNAPQLAALLFGDANRWGKLPVSIYSKNFTTGGDGLPAARMNDYTMPASSGSPGRTYRYYQGRPLFEYGRGLSLTKFTHACVCKSGADVHCTCTVVNEGKMDGDEVVLVYDSLSMAIRTTVGTAHPVPKKRLIDFERVSIRRNASATVVFIIPTESLALTTASGDRKLYPGIHELVFSRGDSSSDITVPVGVTLSTTKLKLDDSEASRQFAGLDCELRRLALNLSRHLLPWAGGPSVFDALRLQECDGTVRPRGSSTPPRSLLDSSGRGVDTSCEFFVSPTGSDDNPGDIVKPFATIHRAQRAVRHAKASRADASLAPICQVNLREGTYYLGGVGALVLSADDSFTTWRAYQSECVCVSGGVLIKRPFTRFEQNDAILVADVQNTTLAKPLMRLFVDGKPMVWARWPNVPPGMDEADLAIPRGRVAAAAPHRGAPDPWKPAVAGPYNWTLPTYGGPQSYFPGYYHNVTFPGYVIPGTNNTMDYTAALGGPYARFEGGVAFSYSALSCPVVPVGLKWTPQLNMSSRVAKWNVLDAPAVLHSMHWSKPADCDGPTVGADAAGTVSCQNTRCSAEHCHHHGDGYWGALAWQLKSVDARARQLRFGAGGAQTTVGCRQAGPWYVEGLLAELDQAGEWFHSASQGKLYVWPNATSSAAATPFQEVVGSVLSEIIVVNGSVSHPVRGVRLIGIQIQHSAPHFAGPYPACGGGDFCTARTGAVVIRGAEDFILSGCEVHHTGGNAVAVLEYNRNVSITSNHFSHTGEVPISLQGVTDWIDATAGNFPESTVIAGNLIHEVATKLRGGCAFFQSLAARTNFVGNVVFSGPRAGLNFNDGMGGGSTVRNNLIFDFVRETADHGNENSWNRLPYLTTVRNGTKSMVPAWNSNEHNFMFRTNFGFMSLDHDDGSSYWKDSGNVIVGGRGWTKHDGPFQEARNNLQILLEDVDLPFLGGTDPPSDKHSQCASVALAGTYTNNTCVSYLSRVNNITQCSPKTGALGGLGLAAVTGGNRYIVPANVTIICGDTEKQTIDHTRILSLDQAAMIGIEVGSKAVPLSELTVGDIVAMARELLWAF